MKFILVEELLPIIDEELLLHEKLLTPKKGEHKKAYISRFMTDETSKEEFPDIKQRFAVCMSYWDRRNK